VLVVILSGYYLARYHNKQTVLNTASPTNANVVSNSAGIVLSVSEVAKHSTRSDCWIIVSGSVYNVTNYLVSHPGGAPIIIPTCGGDATQAYGTKGGSGASHSGSANQDLSSLLIGQVGGTTSAQQINNTNTVNVVRGGEDD
jgi:cytochrome b involved in lipid metabolism